MLWGPYALFKFVVKAIPIFPTALINYNLYEQGRGLGAQYAFQYFKCIVSKLYMA